MRANICLLNAVLLLTAAMTAGCGSESPSRVAFRKIILDRPMTDPRLATFRRKSAAELIWLVTQEGTVVSKVWARVDIAGVGGEIPDEPIGPARVPFAFLEQEPWLVTTTLSIIK